MESTPDRDALFSAILCFFFHYEKLVFISVCVKLLYSETLQGRIKRKKHELRKHTQNMECLFLVIFQSRLMATDRTNSLLPAV
jgi:hypothetical protein